MLTPKLFLSLNNTRAFSSGSRRRCERLSHKASLNMSTGSLLSSTIRHSARDRSRWRRAVIRRNPETIFFPGAFPSRSTTGFSCPIWQIESSIGLDSSCSLILNVWSSKSICSRATSWIIMLRRIAEHLMLVQQCQRKRPNRSLRRKGLSFSARIGYCLAEEWIWKALLRKCGRHPS